MATRYLYNNEKYNSLYSLRQAIGRVERLAYGDIKTQEEFNQLPLQNKVVFEEYDPIDEMNVEVLRSQKMSSMKQAFSQYRNSPDTSIESSLGFKINAGSTAFTDVDGCIAQLEQGIIEPQSEGQEATITFMDYDNQPHNLTLEQLKVLKSEIAANGSRAYAKKWEYREQITAADKEDLKKMAVFNFDE